MILYVSLSVRIMYMFKLGVPELFFFFASIPTVFVYYLHPLHTAAAVTFST